jgi:hypothetical protein
MKRKGQLKELQKMKASGQELSARQQQRFNYLSRRDQDTVQKHSAPERTKQPMPQGPMTSNAAMGGEAMDAMGAPEMRTDMQSAVGQVDSMQAPGAIELQPGQPRVTAPNTNYQNAFGPQAQPEGARGRLTAPNVNYQNAFGPQAQPPGEMGQVTAPNLNYRNAFGRPRKNPGLLGLGAQANGR